MRELTIAAGAVRALMEFAISRGASRQCLAERAGVDPSALQDRDQRVPFSAYVALMRAAQELCRDPALALHFGESVPISQISLGCLIGAYSDTMGEGLALMNRYAPLTVEVDELGAKDRFTFERDGERVWVIDGRPHPNDFPELTESGFARMVSTGRQFLHDQPFLEAVEVTHPEPPYRAEYDRIFRVPVTFGSRRNAILIDASWMSQQPPSPSPVVLEVLKAHSEALLEKLESSKSITGRVEGLLTSWLPSGEATMEKVATELGVSRQTLFRRLKAEGASFEQLLDRVRRGLALRYLNGDGLSVKETAFRLGFSEPASFSRAFKRWTGTSPDAHRRKNLEASTCPTPRSISRRTWSAVKASR
jgi:AraC-like DNA-binding protein